MGWVTTPRSGRFKRSDNHCIGDRVSHRAGMDRCGKYCPHRDSIPGPSVPYQVAKPTEQVPGISSGKVKAAGV